MCVDAVNIMWGVAIQIWILLSQMSPYLLMGFFVAGILRLFFSSEKIAKHLSKGGLWSAVKASAIGVPLPLCSCGVIPVAAHIRKQGASKGATLAFLASTPATGVDSILATYSLLGPIFTVVRPIAALFSGVIAGIFAGTKEDAQNPDNCLNNTCAVCDLPLYEPHKHTLAKKITKAFNYAFFELVEDVAKWLTIGIVVGGLISYIVPDEFFTQYIGSPALAYIIALAVALPMYVCATGSIPIAASLIAKGLPPGAGLAFLIAGPATNTATMSFVLGKLGKRAFLSYMAGIVITSILFGLILDTFWADICADSCRKGISHSPKGWFNIVSAIVMLALVSRAFISQNLVRKKVTNMGKIFLVPDMTCSHCVKALENALRSVNGAEQVRIDLTSKRVEVIGSADDEDIVNAIKNAGYNPQKIEDGRE